MTETGDFGVDDIRKWMCEVRDLRDAREAANSGLGGLLFLFGIQNSWRKKGSSYTHTQIMRMLATDDKRALAPLLQALSLPLGKLKAPVLSTVTRLLFSFEKGDSLEILGPARWRLFHVLEKECPSQSSDLLLGVLYALEKSGTTEDLSAMQFLSVRYNTNAEQQILAAARKCAMAIHGRRGMEKDKKVLLRSTEDLTYPAELLRATRVLPHHEPDMLLRTPDDGLRVGEEVIESDARR
jgi:hypothetical protein